MVACLEGKLLWEAASSKYSLQCRITHSKRLLHLALPPFHPTGIWEPVGKFPAAQLSCPTTAEQFSLQSGVHLKEWLTVSVGLYSFLPRATKISLQETWKSLWGPARTIGANSAWKRGLTKAWSSQLAASAPQTEWEPCLAACSSLLPTASHCSQPCVLQALGRGQVFSHTAAGMRELLSAACPANLISAELRGRLVPGGRRSISAS